MAVRSHLQRTTLSSFSMLADTDTASSASSPSEASIFGKSRLDLPGTSGRSFLHLTTHCEWASLQHFLSGSVMDKEELRQYKEMELLVVNGKRVKRMSHTAVTSLLRQHILRAVAELQLVVLATDQYGRRHQLELTFDVIYEDGPIGDTTRAIYDVIVRIKDKIITTPDVTDVHFEKGSYFRIGHGAQKDRFMKVGADSTLCMDVPGDERDYVFKCYTFSGYDKTRCGGGDGCGGGGSLQTLCVLQKPHTRLYVKADCTTCHLTVGNGELNTDIQSITKPDCRFFIVHRTGNGNDEQFCLAPLILRGYYLRYDVVRGLRLDRCKRPPYEDPACVRFFTFRFARAELRQ